MIKIENLTKIYKGKTVFEDVSIELPTTGLVAITGDSGSGKTTIMNILSGVDSNYTGSVEVFGKLLSRNNLVIRRDIVSCIYQDYGLIREYTVKKNLGLVINSDKSCSIESVLNNVGMSEYLDVRVDKLSGGQAQRIAVARAILKTSKVIIADEPTGNLDVRNRNMVFEKLVSLSKEKLVILITHDLELVGLCDETYFIRNQKIMK